MFLYYRNTNCLVTTIIYNEISDAILVYEKIFILSMSNNNF